MRLRRLLIIGTCAAWLAGCGGDPSQGERGTLVAVEPMGSYRQALLQQLLALYEAPVSLEPRLDVEAYRIVYLTADADGAVVEASGALFLPAGGANLPMISLQHSFQTDRSAVASVSPLKYGPDALLAASVGYATCAPDYIGLGTSRGIHPFLHAGSSANAVMDFVRACRSFCANEGITLNGQLFLGGYSEGAYVTLAAQRSMEAESAAEFPITAVACLSGPYDVAATTAAVLADPGRRDVVFPACMLAAYDSIYGWNRLGEIFLQPYAGQIAALFDGSHSLEEIENALPGAVGELVAPGFRAGYAGGTEAGVLAAVRENTLLNWRPVAPIRLYHGTADNLAPFDNALAALNSLGSQPGTSVALYPVNGAGHEEAIMVSIDPAFQWFESLRR
jgi:hypothetical protein